MEGEYEANDSRKSESINTENQHMESSEAKYSDVGQSCFGPWILAKKPTRQRKQMARNQGAECKTGGNGRFAQEKEKLPISGGSRFNALNDLDVHEMQDRADVSFQDQGHNPSTAHSAGTSKPKAQSRQKPKGSQNQKAMQNPKDAIYQKHGSTKAPAHDSHATKSSSSNPV